MSDGSLSQEEIDALLQGTDDIISDIAKPEMESSGAGGESTISQNILSSFGNSLGLAATNQAEAFGAMVGKSVAITAPKVEVISLKNLQGQLQNDIVEVKMDYDTGVMGEHSYIADINTAKTRFRSHDGTGRRRFDRCIIKRVKRSNEYIVRKCIDNYRQQGKKRNKNSSSSS